MYYRNEFNEYSYKLIQNFFRQYLKRKEYNKNVIDAMKNSKFKEIAICNLQDMAIHFHEIDKQLMVLKRNFGPININRKYAK